MNDLNGLGFDTSHINPFQEFGNKFDLNADTRGIISKDKFNTVNPDKNTQECISPQMEEKENKPDPNADRSAYVATLSQQRKAYEDL